MHSVMDVAKWFLSRSSMTHKKLQKLCYYAQAWKLALFDDGPMFMEDVQAWVHGPVIPTLYHAYSGYKWELIPKVAFDSSGFSEEDISVLEAVYDSYGDLSGDQLEALTHTELPWKQVRGDLEPWETSTKVIPHELMRSYYQELYERNQND